MLRESVVSGLSVYSTGPLSQADRQGPLGPDLRRLRSYPPLGVPLKTRRLNGKLEAHFSFDFLAYFANLGLDVGNWRGELASPTH